MATIKRTFGQQTIGGGGSAPAAAAPTHKVLQILYGQTVAGINCIKHTGTIPTSVSPDFSGASYVFNTSFSPEGIGSAYLWTDGIRSENPVYVVNRNEIYNHLLLSRNSHYLSNSQYLGCWH
jgi:hypothetical protein